MGPWRLLSPIASAGVVKATAFDVCMEGTMSRLGCACASIPPCTCCMAKGSAVGMYAGMVDDSAVDVWVGGDVCTRRCFGAGGIGSGVRVRNGAALEARVTLLSVARDIDECAGEMVRNGAAAETRVGMELGIAELCVGMDIDGRPKNCAPDAFVSRLLAL